LEKIKNKINIENLLLIYIALLPILDFISFLFRNTFDTVLSPVTFIRPIIPIIIIFILFIKNKFKLNLIIISLMYGIYAAIHLFVFYRIKTDISYGTIWHELQYLINYTFSILTLFIFFFILNKKNTNKFKKYTLIAMMIYIISIYISIITSTYSSTYVEGMGIKGWFESGNSLGSILILGLFILFTMIKSPKINILVIPTILLIGFYLIKLIGTRVRLIWIYFCIMCVYMFRNICYF